MTPSANPTGIGFTGHVNDPDTGLVYMQQRYYDPIAGRFLSVDPITTDAKTGGHFNRYLYADNNPYKYIDPDGQESFSVSRPLDNAALGCCFSHNFVVSNATFVGDPKATVHSWGNTGNGTTGRVTSQTTGMSKTTAATDQKFWKHLAKDSNSAKVNTTKINASDASVDDKSNGVQENTKYATVPSAQGNETNSNSVASAVANGAQGSEVAVPGGGRISTGVGAAEKSKLWKNND